MPELSARSRRDTEAAGVGAGRKSAEVDPRHAGIRPARRAVYNQDASEVQSRCRVPDHPDLPAEKSRRPAGFGRAEIDAAPRCGIGRACHQHCEQRSLLGRGQGDAEGAQEESNAHHRSVYRYAVISRASDSLMPMSGMAVPGSTCCGCWIHRIMFDGEFDSCPAR